MMITSKPCVKPPTVNTRNRHALPLPSPPSEAYREPVLPAAAARRASMSLYPSLVLNRLRTVVFLIFLSTISSPPEAPPWTSPPSSPSSSSSRRYQGRHHDLPYRQPHPPPVHKIYSLNHVAHAVPITDADFPPSPNPTPSPFLPSDIITSSFKSATRLTPRSLCPAASISFTRLLVEDSVHPYRLPHSSILMDQRSCGRFPLNATDSQLFADDYIALVPISTLYDEQTAVTNHAAMLYDEFFTRNRSFTRSFFDFARQNEGRSTVYIGLEWYGPRTCKNDIVVPRLTYMFFALFQNPVDLGALLPYESYMTIPARAPFHLSFTPISVEGIAEYGCVFYRPTPTPIARSVPLRLCFPAHAKVTLIMQTEREREREREREMVIKQLKIGDLVKDVDGKITRVIAFSHRDEHVTTLFRRVSFNVSNDIGTLTVSHGHLVMLANRTLARSDTLRIGTRLLLMRHNHHHHQHQSHCYSHSQQRNSNNGKKNDVVIVVVTNVTDVWERGLYNPQTSSGTLLVNDVAVSCYTSAVPFRSAHALLTPVRATVHWFYWLRSYLLLLSSSSSSSSSSQIPPVVVKRCNDTVPFESRACCDSQNVTMREKLSTLTTTSTTSRSSHQTRSVTEISDADIR